MKKITGKLSLQWRLTLITALLMTVTCILMYFFISQSAVAGMEDLGDYMIRIDNTDSAPITFNMNPSVLFPELSDQLQLTKKLFLTKGLMVTGIIILLSSICTYFISRQALLPLRRLSQEVNKIEAQNLSKTLEVPATNDEISHLTISFNKMLARLKEHGIAVPEDLEKYGYCSEVDTAVMNFHVGNLLDAYDYLSILHHG